MKNRIFCFLIFFIALTTSDGIWAQCEDYKASGQVADTTYMIRYNGYAGYIFPDNYHGNIADTSVETFRLTHKQVGRIEEILMGNYNAAFINDPRVSTKYRPVKNVKDYLKVFDRQYLGFMNESGEHCALLILANRKGKNKGYFHCFERVMKIGSGDFYARNQRFFIVNIDKNLLLLP